jgi:hypothetical protein
MKVDHSSTAVPAVRCKSGTKPTLLPPSLWGGWEEPHRALRFHPAAFQQLQFFSALMKHKTFNSCECSVHPSQARCNTRERRRLVSDQRHTARRLLYFFLHYSMQLALPFFLKNFIMIKPITLK